MMLVMLGCKPQNKAPAKSPAGFDAKWDSISKYLKDVNAFYAAYIDSNGNVYEKVHGNNANGAPVSGKTLFEGASLSKTVFAFLYWRLLTNGRIDRADVSLPACGFSDPIPVPPMLLLNHLVPCKDSCVDNNKLWNTFAYSEAGYLLLQKRLEKNLGQNLEELSRENVFDFYRLFSSSFVWQQSNTDFVNGFYENAKLHRPIYKYFAPLSNGSLYIPGSDLLQFTKILMYSQEIDSMSYNSSPVPGFSNLSWGRGIGKEINKGKNYLWQWGSDWSYNHILLINKTDHSAFILLTNSIIGAKRARETTNWLLDTQFQLFDYINWY